MDFQLSADQKLLMSSFEGLLDRFRHPPQGNHGYQSFSTALQNELIESGYLDIINEPDFGVLEAALLIEATASCPVSAEIAASILIAPLIEVSGLPLTVTWNARNPVRYLKQAKAICICNENQVVIAEVDEEHVESVDSVVAYPLGRLTEELPNAVTYSGEMASTIKKRALIGLAAEAAGLMRGALDHTVQYVKDREQFGRPLGHFQAIQHRLAEDAQLVRASRSLALRAAYLDCEHQAALACLYVQHAMRKIINDCHQFCGAMGLTLEFPLHLWTYRLKYLQGEAGGRGAQAQQVATYVWSKGTDCSTAA